MEYDIMENGSIVRKSPIVGSWYGHFETVAYGNATWDRSGTVAKYLGDGNWEDEDGSTDISMVSEYWPDYLVLQD